MFSVPPEAGWSLWVQGQPSLQSMFQISQDYIVRACIKNKKQTNNNFDKYIVLGEPRDFLGVG